MSVCLCASDDMYVFSRAYSVGVLKIVVLTHYIFVLLRYNASSEILPFLQEASESAYLCVMQLATNNFSLAHELRQEYPLNLSI